MWILEQTPFQQQLVCQPVSCCLCSCCLELDDKSFFSREEVTTAERLSTSTGHATKHFSFLLGLHLAVQPFHILLLCDLADSQSSKPAFFSSGIPIVCMQWLVDHFVTPAALHIFGNISPTMTCTKGILFTIPSFHWLASLAEPTKIRSTYG